MLCCHHLKSHLSLWNKVSWCLVPSMQQMHHYQIQQSEDTIVLNTRVWGLFVCFFVCLFSEMNKRQQQSQIKSVLEPGVWRDWTFLFMVGNRFLVTLGSDCPSFLSCSQSLYKEGTASMYRSMKWRLKWNCVDTIQVLQSYGAPNHYIPQHEPTSSLFMHLYYSFSLAPKLSLVCMKYMLFLGCEHEIYSLEISRLERPRLDNLPVSITKSIKNERIKNLKSNHSRITQQHYCGSKVWDLAFWQFQHWCANSDLCVLIATVVATRNKAFVVLLFIATHGIADIAMFFLKTHASGPLQKRAEQINVMNETDLFIRKHGLYLGKWTVPLSYRKNIAHIKFYTDFNALLVFFPLKSKRDKFLSFPLLTFSLRWMGMLET